MSLLEGLSKSSPKEINSTKEKVKQYLNEKGWSFDKLDDGFYQLTFDGNPSFNFTIQIGTGMMYVNCELPFEIPENKRKIVNRFINMANYRINYGHFDIDHFYGFVYYKYTVQFVGEDVNYDYINTAIVGAFSYMARLIPGFEAVVNNQLTPTKALNFALNS